MRDTDVESKGDSLQGKRILLGVTGGIAAVDTIRVSRELRRHGAEVTVIMTQSSQQIVTPLAVRWASQGEVITEWDGDLSSLENFDGILVTPATKNTMAAFSHGMMNGPLLMALSAARGKNTPIMFVPSMHNDLADDIVTKEVEKECRLLGCEVYWGPNEEGKMKTPDYKVVVAKFSNFLNKNNTSVVITLGATQSSIDDVRFIQNSSSGKTGYLIADYLYRKGMDITCVVGATEVSAPAFLPLVIQCKNPDDMLLELKALSKDKIDVWIHAAAVLDYVVKEPIEGKIASLQGEISVPLGESVKHIAELRNLCEGSVRIGFKLESGIKQKDLIHRAVAQIEKSGMTATIANRLEDLNDDTNPRAWLVDKTGAHYKLETNSDLCEAILSVILNNR